MNSILLECSKISNDEFWKQFYMDLATGKSFRGITLSGDTIYSVRSKKNGFSYYITDKTPEIIISELQHLLVTQTNIYNSTDIERKNSIIDEIKSEFDSYDNTDKWTSVKNKNIRDMYIINFTIKLIKKHDIPWSNAHDIYNTIINAFESKSHSSKDVVYNNGKIKYIADIEYCPIERKVVNKRPFPEKQIIEVKKNKLQNLFEPYINTIIKNITSK